MTFKVIDAHVHLNWIGDVEKAVQSAKSAGVGGIIFVGYDLPSNDYGLELGRRYKGFIFPAMGMHPWWTEKEDIKPIIKHMEEHINECVAVGEVGLDYNYFNYFFYPEAFKPIWANVKIRRHSKDLQKHVFESALKIAAKYNKPVIVHSLTADEDAVRMVKDFGVKAMFHNFMTPELVKEVINGGHYLAAGPRLIDHVEAHIEVIKLCPLDRLIIETDAPVPIRGEGPSEPADALRVLKAVADLRGRGVYDLADQTTKNAVNLFNLDVQL